MLGKYSTILRRVAIAGRRSVNLARRDPQAILLVGRMAWWVVVVSVSARILPLPRALRLIAPRHRLTSATGESSIPDARAAQLLDALLATDFLVFTPSCWKRSAALYRHIAARNTDARIRFGVRKEADGVLAGHAWIEIGDAPVYEKSFPDYRVTFSFPD
jgi:hypothetical protein